MATASARFFAPAAETVSSRAAFKELATGRPTTLVGNRNTRVPDGETWAAASKNLCH